MAATPVLAIPYPVGTDRVMDGDNAMQAIAERVEARLPYGIVGYAENTAGEAGFAAGPQPMTGLTITATIPANRRLRITGKTRGSTSNANESFSILIRVDGTDVNKWEERFSTANVGQTMLPQAVVTLAAGSHTFTLSVLRGVGTGSFNSNATTAEPAFILVEDIGSSLTATALPAPPDEPDGETKPVPEEPDGETKPVEPDEPEPTPT